MSMTCLLDNSFLFTQSNIFVSDKLVLFTLALDIMPRGEHDDIRDMSYVWTLSKRCILIE